jgi:hypothetical protein
LSNSHGALGAPFSLINKGDELAGYIALNTILLVESVETTLAQFIGVPAALLNDFNGLVA